MELYEESVIIPSELIPIICGINDSIIRYLEKYFRISIYIGDGELVVQGEPARVRQALDVLSQLISSARTKTHIAFDEVKLLVDQSIDNNLLPPSVKTHHSMRIDKLGKKIEPKTQNQIKYFNALKEKDLVISFGPAGTGKTYLAVGFALQQLMSDTYKKLIITRPVVEAGEKLGFLPGDFIEKISPYLRPLYDAIFDIAGPRTYDMITRSDIMEIVPLAYMRGRTLNDAIIILDEAQNTTITQMKMFLTRFGFNSKVIINGDISQIDLNKRSDSGLALIVQLLKNIDGIAMIEFGNRDVVRHPLVKKILSAFDAYERRNNS